MQTINIPNLFKRVAEKVSTVLSRTQSFEVFFDYGVYDTVSKNLISKDISISSKDRKYPLIWLVTPFDQDKNNLDCYCEIVCEVLILMGTNATDTNEQRDEKWFDPYLRPIYSEFLTQISRSNFFQVLSPESIEHDVKEWHYYGENNRNLFNDYIDAIQIKKLRLKVNNI